MRILYVHAGNMYGGTERVLETLACERSARPALEPRFALCFDGRLAARLRAAGVAVDRLGPARITRPHLAMQARSRLARIIQRDLPDVLVTQSAWSHAIFAPVARRFELPLVFWAHDLLSGRPYLERLAKRWTPDLVICNSQCTESAARALYPWTPTEVVHGPLSFVAHTTPARVRLQSATAVGSVVIVHVGRMAPLKGHLALVDALAELHVEKAWTCWFVGGAQDERERQYERMLRQRVRALELDDRVRFLGERTDVLDVLAEADIYCQPNTTAEAFGLSLVEALGAGLPVVATDLGGAREIVTSSCGRLVARGNREGLVDALAWLVQDSAARQALASGGPARAWELCNAPARLAQLDACFERVAGNVAV
jgi:glycosyltransferase involved in cell wall biosynthesis